MRKAYDLFSSVESPPLVFYALFHFRTSKKTTVRAVASLADWTWLPMTGHSPPCLKSMVSIDCCSGQGNTSHSLREAERRCKCSVRAGRGHQWLQICPRLPNRAPQSFWETSSYQSTLHFCHSGAPVLSVYQQQRSGDVIVVPLCWVCTNNREVGLS